MTKFKAALLAVAAALAVAAYLDFVYAPQDALQGPVQRIFYLHVAAIIAGYFCFATVLVGGILYLWRESLTADRLARAAAQVGLVMTSVTLAMGIVWAKAAWNWDPSQTWDARFTSTAMLWAVYAGYLMVRRYAPAGRTAARLGAVVGIVGFFDVPIVHFSVTWWRTLHPGPVIESNALPAPMLIAFLYTMVAVLALAALLVWARYRIEVSLDERQEEAAAEPPAVLARPSPLGGR
jgi:heme exporter protein C